MNRIEETVAYCYTDSGQIYVKLIKYTYDDHTEYFLDFCDCEEDTYMSIDDASKGYVSYILRAIDMIQDKPFGCGNYDNSEDIIGTLCKNDQMLSTKDLYITHMIQEYARMCGIIFCQQSKKNKRNIINLETTRDCSFQTIDEIVQMSTVYVMAGNLFVAVMGKNVYIEYTSLDVIHQSTGESICKSLIHEIYPNEKFKKCRPNWLKNPMTKRNLELGVYNDNLKIAIECNGKQHYEYCPYFHANESTFQQQKNRDALKMRLCQEHGVNLIIIPYTCKTTQDIKNEIIKQLSVHK